MNKTLIGALVAVVVVGCAAFYAGTSYAKSQTPQRGSFGAGQYAGFAGRGGMRGTGSAGGGITAGSILSKDAGSMTVKMQDGSTKIILFGTSTQIMKTTSGSASDLSTGTNVVVTGTSNSDGSLTAQSVQIRPAGMPPQGTTRPPQAQ